MQYATVTGIPVEDVAPILQAIFDNHNAYKGVPGGADLTDISTGFMLERVTQVFGLKGFGWNFSWKPEDTDLIVDGKRALARIKYAEFSYNLLDEEGNAHWFFVPTGGANENSVAYAEEGARTSALGAALKGLTFQLPIYKGEYDHHDAQRQGQKPAAQKGAVPQKAAPAQKPKPAAPAAKPAVAWTTNYTPDQLADALNATVPTGIPLAGKTLAEALTDQQFGIYVVKFLAKEAHNAASKWFEPQNAEDEALVEKAKIVLRNAEKVASN